MKTFGLISLNGAGISLAKKLMADGCTVVAFDYDADSRRKMAAAGLVMTSSIRAVLLHLPSPKTVYVAVAEGDQKMVLMKQLAEWLEPGGMVIDEPPA
jgi:6-phosphogluconate dehydrogenase